MIKIDRITSKNEWDSLLSHTYGYDFFHSWEYHMISKELGDGDPIFFNIHDDKGGLLFPLLERTINKSYYKDLTSVYGYPGPLVYGKYDTNKVRNLWVTFKEKLLSDGYISLFSRLHPIFTPDIITSTDGSHLGSVVFVDLKRSINSQFKQYRKGHKSDIKNMIKLGVKCTYSCDSDSLNKFIYNYESTMKLLDADAKYFFPISFYRSLLQAKDFQTRIYSCELNGEVICSGLFIFCNNIVQYYLSGNNPNFRKIPASKLMLDTVRVDANTEKYMCFILGGGLGSNEDSLFRFKSGFSKQKLTFSVMKLVLNVSVYNKLSVGLPETTMFPKYRLPPC